MIDIHTHSNPDISTRISYIRNVRYPVDAWPVPVTGYFSVGVDPWDTGREDLDRNELEEWINRPHCLAVGEIGLDTMKGPEPKLQKTWFTLQLEIAGKLGKPVIIHCVRSWDALLDIHSSLTHATGWIIHGFRGKPGLAGRLLNAGCYLSYGSALLSDSRLAESLAQTPLERLFLETDDSRVPLESIYRQASQLKGITTTGLNSYISGNFERIFGIHANP